LAPTHTTALSYHVALPFSSGSTTLPDAKVSPSFARDPLIRNRSCRNCIGSLRSFRCTGRHPAIEDQRHRALVYDPHLHGGAKDPDRKSTRMNSSQLGISYA